MTSPNLENLAKRGSLKRESPDRREIDTLLKSGKARLRDARRGELALESRFDLAYNAAHAIALAALRSHGYRSEKRYLVFQCLEDTLGLAPALWRVLALCHERRNVAEYEGHLEVDEQLMLDLLRVTDAMLEETAARIAATR